MAVDEFEIKQVLGNRNLDTGNSSRSLVFKISKRINKASKPTVDQKLTVSSSVLRKEVSEPLLSFSSKLNLDDIFHNKHLSETRAAKETVAASRNVGPVLRRTSKRIYLRVGKQNFEVNEKISGNQKIRNPIKGTVKQQGHGCVKMGRRRGGRKTIPTAVNPKCESIRRCRGRPRKVNRDQPVEMKKMVSTGNCKMKKKPFVVADSSSVWTLVPKELANSHFFKSRVLRMHEKRPRSRKHPFSDRESTKFPANSSVPTSSTRPTVIYFNNGHHLNSPDQQQFLFSSRQLCGNAEHGFSRKIIEGSNHLTRDMPLMKKFTADSFSNQQHWLKSHLMTDQEDHVVPSNGFAFQSNGYDRVSDPSSSQFGSYFPCGQDIVDAIRILYDDESVLGYA